MAESSQTALQRRPRVVVAVGATAALLVIASGLGAAMLMTGGGDRTSGIGPTERSTPPPAVLDRGGTPKPSPMDVRSARRIGDAGAKPTDPATPSPERTDSATPSRDVGQPFGPTPTPFVAGQPGQVPPAAPPPSPGATPEPEPERTSPPPRPAISVSDESVTEGATGETVLEFTISLSVPAPPEGVDIGWSATPDAPEPQAEPGGGCGADVDTGTDYASLQPFHRTITEGQTSLRVGVRICGDLRPEPDEFFTVRLTYTSENADVADGIGIGRIMDDDPG